MRKFTAALLGCFFCMLFLTGCNHQISFTWTVDRVPANLDPQLAESGPELMAVYNLYSGLVRLDAEGVPQPECAENWTESDDGLVYTFHLKSDLQYAKLRHHEKEYPLTAADFEFAFHRMFDPSTGSPYISSFLCLENSQQVLSGQLPPSALGVRALDEQTLEFRLSRPEPQFLQNLALPGAMPCNEEFFNSTQGAYGLTSRGSISANVLSNGPFALYNWNEHGLFLRRSEQGRQVTSLRIVLNETGSPATSNSPPTPPLAGADLVLQNKATAALSEDVSHPGLDSISYADTTWVLAMNNAHPLLGQTSVRQALASCISETPLPLPAGSQPASGLVPAALTIDGQPYRELAGDVMPQFGDPVELCRQGLAAAGATRFENITIIMPEGHDCLRQAEALNQQWQQHLSAFSAYFSLKELPMDEFTRRVQSGDYQLALVPFTPITNSVPDLLSQIQITSPSTEFLSLLEEFSYTGNHDPVQLAQAERSILESAAVVPLWQQNKALLIKPGVSGLVFRPFGPVLDLTWATIKE